MSSTMRSGNAPRSNELALFALGFRPFYLLAALVAALSLPVWAAQYFGVLPMVGLVSGVAWHTHEMVFGFAIAVITGFLFTAVRNWTGLPTPSGRGLAALACLWVAGRIVMLTGPSLLAALVDVAFLPAVAWSLWRPLHAARNRNQFFVAILAALAAVNAVFHTGHAGLIDVSPVRAMHIALAIVVMIVAIMAGRVIPAFTRNAVPAARVRMVRGLDAASLACLAGALIAWLAGLPAWLVVPLAVAAAVTHAARLWSWDPWSTRRQPILWILHVSYAWIPVGMLLLALAVAGVAGTTALGLHALGAGAVGGMIIGMITRTARGHTGRPLRVGASETLAYALVHLAALIRVILPLLWPQAYAAGIVVSAALWSAAFAIYLAVYGPFLLKARADGRPG
ncbi:MAG: NnrS family protein [Burkholderiales bacterium]|nr:NnrS family protein [Burkholderiales bacterium]